MEHWRLTVNQRNGRCTVERKNAPHLIIRPWRFYGIVASLDEAQELIRAGWPDDEGRPCFPVGEAYTLEIVDPGPFCGPEGLEDLIEQGPEERTREGF